MRFWVRARRAVLILSVSLLALFVLTLLTQNTSVSLPSIVSGTTASVVLSMFVPLVAVSGLLGCLDSRLPAAEASGVRPVALLDAALSAGTVVAASAAGLGAALLIGDRDVATVGRNTAFLVGVALLARAFFGQKAALVPVAWLMTVVFLGFRSRLDPYPWTILPEPIGAPHAAAGSALAFLVGIAAQLIISTRKLP
ncbi:hypothetical protein [Streptomyces sp. CRN 30]|uniref:hypothetical protein n=1 Tax=Streptomyces sp. CRN 30 TaxID=3075613 RepID=UPI002A801C33|nr:hypothetical protein [Streptomyces sp. CRN 30]